MTIYENKNYKVEILEEPVDEKNFAVINKEFNTVEATTQNLPQALTHADQFDVIINSELHRAWAEGEAVSSTLLTPQLPAPDESIN